MPASSRHRPATGRGGCSRASGASTRVARRVPRVRRLRGAAQALKMGAGRRHRGGDGVEADGPRRGRVPDRAQVGRGRRAAGHAPLPRVQRRRVRARHVQGPRDPRARPVRARRVDDDRRLRGRRLARLPLPPRRVPARAPAPRSRHRPGARAPTCWAPTSAAQDGRSTSSSGSARAPTSPARRRRCSSRSRAARPEPRNKPPFPVEVGLFGKPTVVNNVETLANVPLILRDGGGAYATIGTEGSTGPSCSASRATSSGRASTRSSSATAARPHRARRRRHGRPADPGDPAGRGGGRVRRARQAGRAAHVRGHARRRRDARVRGDPGVRRDRGPRRRAAPDRGVLPRRVVRPVRAVPRRHGAPGGADRPAPGRAGRSGSLDAELALFSRPRAGHARRVDLRPRPDGVVGDRERHPAAASSTSTPWRPARDRPDDIARIYTELPARPSRVPEAPPAAEVPTVELRSTARRSPSRPGRRSSRPRARSGIDTPTLCYLENLTPVNVCRVCVVEVTGSRVLVPACSRASRPGWRSRPTASASAISRRLVLELLESSVDLSLAGPAEPDGDLARYADAVRRRRRRGSGRPPRRPPRASATPASPGTTTPRRRSAAPGRRRDRRPAGEGRQRPLRARLLALHPLLQVRRGLRRGRPEHVRDRRRRARLRRADLDRVRRGRCPNRPASTAATASASARPAR